MYGSAIHAKDIRKFGKAFKASFDAQVAMFPLMKSKTVRDTIEIYKDKALGWKLAGAGGGGYLVLVSEDPIENAIRIRIRRSRGETKVAEIKVINNTLIFRIL